MYRRHDFVRPDPLHGGVWPYASEHRVSDNQQTLPHTAVSEAAAGVAAATQCMAAGGVATWALADCPHDDGHTRKAAAAPLSRQLDSHTDTGAVARLPGSLLTGSRQRIRRPTHRCQLGDPARPELDVYQRHTCWRHTGGRRMAYEGAQPRSEVGGGDTAHHAPGAATLQFLRPA